MKKYILLVLLSVLLCGCAKTSMVTKNKLDNYEEWVPLINFGEDLNTEINGKKLMLSINCNYDDAKEYSLVLCKTLETTSKIELTKKTIVIEGSNQYIFVSLEYKDGLLSIKSTKRLN